MGPPGPARHPSAPEQRPLQQQPVHSGLQSSSADPAYVLRQQQNVPTQHSPLQQQPVHSGFQSSSADPAYVLRQQQNVPTQHSPLHSSTPNKFAPPSSSQLGGSQQQQQPSTRSRIPPTTNQSGVHPPFSPPLNSGFQQPQQNKQLNQNPRKPLPPHLPENDRPGPSHQEEEEPMDESDGPPGIHTNIRVDISSKQEVCDSTPVILSSFIADRMAYDGHTVPQNLRNLPKRESAIAGVLRQMGDDISKNYKLNHLISEIQVTPNTAYKTFASVASQIFVDGSINWGRVVMLFYFAYKLALQVLNQIPLIDIIIGWVTKFVKDRISTWISNQGGWNGIREYYGSSTGQMVGVFLAGILVSTLFWYWRR